MRLFQPVQVAELLMGLPAPVIYWEQGHEWVFGDPIRFQVPCSAPSSCEGSLAAGSGLQVCCSCAPLGLMFAAHRAPISSESQQSRSLAQVTQAARAVTDDGDVTAKLKPNM